MASPHASRTTRYSVHSARFLLLWRNSLVHCCFSPCLYLLKCNDSRHQQEVLAIGLQQVISMQCCISYPHRGISTYVLLSWTGFLKQSNPVLHLLQFRHILFPSYRSSGYQHFFIWVGCCSYPCEAWYDWTSHCLCLKVYWKKIFSSWEGGTCIVKKFHQYLYGQIFTLVKDLKSLPTIFGPKRAFHLRANLAQYCYCHHVSCQLQVWCAAHHTQPLQLLKAIYLVTVVTAFWLAFH